jgi:predicted nucleic acid-binding protein
MNVLADTNILVRGIHRKDPQHKEALRAIQMLRNAGDTVCIVPQNLYDLWTVATRPASRNGLALTPEQAGRVLTRMEQLFVLKRDTPAVYDEWRRLVSTLSTSGKASYDARLVAAMNVHGIDHVLTFNIDDFKRYIGITVLDPGEVQSRPAEPQPEPQQDS